MKPEPLSRQSSDMIQFPSDEGLQTRFFRYSVTVLDGMGVAGRLGVSEEVCLLGAHEEEHWTGNCELCGAVV